jgi:hypothetical protein
MELSPSFNVIFTFKFKKYSRLKEKTFSNIYWFGVDDLKDIHTEVSGRVIFSLITLDVRFFLSISFMANA